MELLQEKQAARERSASASGELDRSMEQMRIASEGGTDEEQEEEQEEKEEEGFVVIPKKRKRGGRRHQKKGPQEEDADSFAAFLRKAVAVGLSVDEAKARCLQQRHAPHDPTPAPTGSAPPPPPADDGVDSGEDKVTNMSKRSSTRSSYPLKNKSDVLTKPCCAPLL